MEVQGWLQKGLFKANSPQAIINMIQPLVCLICPEAKRFPD